MDIRWAKSYKNKGVLMDYDYEDPFEGSVETAEPGTFKNQLPRIFPAGIHSKESLIQETAYLGNPYLNGREHAILGSSVRSLHLSEKEEVGVFGVLSALTVRIGVFHVMSVGTDKWGREVVEIDFQAGRKRWSDYKEFLHTLNNLKFVPSLRIYR